MKLSCARTGIVFASIFVTSSLNAQAQTVETTGKDSKFFVESFSYEEEAYSSSEKQGANENPDVEAVLKYQYNENTYARFRLQLNGDTPDYDPKKTSKFELGLFHREGRVFGFVDFELNGNDNGGLSLGFDEDSRYSMIGVNIHSELSIQYNPYNLGTKIGSEFETAEVAEVHYIDTPIDVISNIPVSDEAITSKTTPGFMVNWDPEKTVSVSLGYGVVSYLYPTGKDVSIYEGLVSKIMAEETR